MPVILGEIRLLFREGGAVKLSRSLQELSRKAKRIEEEYRQKTGTDITVNALAKQLGTDAYKAAQALNASRATLSLSGEDDDGGLEIPVPSTEDELTDRLSLEQALAALSDDEQQLITLRYYRHKTQSATAKALGTTQVQVSRREKRILLKMRMMLA